ncbi:conserved hypothetical protein [Flavobacterium sp. 9AF]|uniref:hypothetical protein n=1 Tax=Flavobacterium sp. 9AF TaxID=2653142 RepID=UPI0012F3F39F|nr:hypothetical protein [Flavobacterium sp. 9AF]VXB85117.1 conserved hypothetical protein [Flavobacterium sp. 9AF]
MSLQQKIQAILLESKTFFSLEWKRKHGTFLEEEIQFLFSKELVKRFNEIPNAVRLPFFEEEIIQNYPDVVSQFKAVFTNENEIDNKEICTLIENTPFSVILWLMGQRITSASKQDEEAIPPIHKILLESCFQPLNKETTVVVKAWEKHVGRYPESIFETLKGNQKEKEITISKQIDYIIENQTWWNIFYHYKHGLVYEIRMENGQGMRWTSDGKQFIGFLEQFLNE